MKSAVVCTALRIEANAVRRGWPDADIAVVGMRARQLPRLGARLHDANPAVLLGFGGGLRPGQRPGDVVVATQLHDASGVLELPLGAQTLATLRRAGIAASGGAVWCSDHIVHGAERAAHAKAAVVDMESAPLARALGAHRLIVVRVIVDTPAIGLVRASITSGRRARRQLRAVAAALADAELAADGERTGIEPITSGTVQMAAPILRGAATAVRGTRAHSTSKEG